MEITGKCSKTLFAFILLLSLLSCDWDAMIHNAIKNSEYHKPTKEGHILDSMPDKTQSGANTFGCYVDNNLVAVQGRNNAEGRSPEMYNRFYSLVNGFLMKEYLSKKDVMKLEIFASPHYIELEFDSIFIGKHLCQMYYYYDNNKGLIIRGIPICNVNVTYWDDKQCIISGEIDDIIGDFKITPMSSPIMRDTLITLKNGRFDVKYGKDY